MRISFAPCQWHTNSQERISLLVTKIRSAAPQHNWVSAIVPQRHLSFLTMAACAFAHSHQPHIQSSIQGKKQQAVVVTCDLYARMQHPLDHLLFFRTCADAFLQSWKAYLAASAFSPCNVQRFYFLMGTYKFQLYWKIKFSTFTQPEPNRVDNLRRSFFALWLCCCFTRIYFV